MDNRKTIIFLGSLFLALLIITMLFVNLARRNFEGMGECVNGFDMDGKECQMPVKSNTSDISNSPTYADSPMPGN